MQENRKAVWKKAALCCAGYGMVSNGIVTPAITKILASFNGTGLHMMNFILSGPNLIAIPFALLAGILTRYISKRNLLITALVMFCIGGIGGAITWDAGSLAVTRALDGASDGLVTVIASALIAEVYRGDEKTQSQVFGWMNALTSILGVVTSFVAGVLATVNWRLSFLLNCLALISLVLAVLFIPQTPLERKPVRTEHRKNAQDRKMTAVFAANMVFYSILSVVFYQIVFLICIFVDEMQLGGTVLAGSLTSLITATMSVTYLVFGIIYTKLKGKMPVLMLFITGTAIAGISFVGNIVPLAICIGAATFAAMASVAYYPVVIAKIAPQSKTTLWMSIYTVLMYSVSYLSTYVPSVVSRLFGTTTISSSFLYSGGLLIICGIIHLLLQKWLHPEQIAEGDEP